MRQRVSAILVAAGSSTRMGTLKQLLPFHGKPLIEHGISALLEAGLEDVVVLLSPDQADVMQIVARHPVRQAFNETPGSDMAASVCAGLLKIDPASTAVIVHLADHPRVSAGTVRRLIDVHREEPSAILIPRFEGRSGHPVLFPRDCMDELPRGGTLRDIVTRHADRRRFVDVRDEGVIEDIDTPADYEKMVGRG